MFIKCHIWVLMFLQHITNGCRWSVTSGDPSVFKQEDANIRVSLSLTCLSHANDPVVEEPVYN